MDSERFHSKERLAVERRAQPNFKAIAGDSSAAAWAHMRQRLSRAERDARTARRVAVVLSGISLLGIGGVLAIVLPWSAAVGSDRTPGDVPFRLKYGQALRPLGRAPAADLPRSDRRLSAPAGTPAPHDARPEQSHETGKSALDRHESPTVAPAVVESTAVPGRVKAADASKGVLEVAQSPDPPSGRATLPRGRRAEDSPELGHPSKPAPLSRPAHPAAVAPPLGHAQLKPQMPTRPQSRLARGGRGFDRWTTSTVQRQHPRWRRRRTWRSHWHSGRWRLVRVSHRGAMSYCLVDPHGNRWEARRVHSGHAEPGSGSQ